MKRDQIQWILTQKLLPRKTTRERDSKGLKIQPQTFIDQDHPTILATTGATEEIGLVVTEDDMATTAAILRENKVQTTSINSLKIIINNRAFSMVMTPNQNKKTNTGGVGITDKINPGFLTRDLGEGIEIMATTSKHLNKNLRSQKILLRLYSLTTSASFQAAEKATDPFTQNQIAP